MKKITAVFLFIVLFLCGCSADKKSEKSYSLPKTPVSVSFKEDETCISGVMNYVSPQEMTFSLSLPKEAEGFVFLLKDGSFSLGFDGVFCTPENIQNLFGRSKGFQTLFEAFSALGEKENVLSKQQFKFSYPLGEAVVSFDEGGFLKSLRAGVYDFEFTKITENA